VQNFKDYREGFGVSDRTHSLHNLSLFWATSVTLMKIRSYKCWGSLENKVCVEAKNWYLYNSCICCISCIMTWTNWDSVKLAKSNCNKSIIVLELKSVPISMIRIETHIDELRFFLPFLTAVCTVLSKVLICTTSFTCI